MARKPKASQSLGERVRAMRKRLNLDLDQLAEKTGFKAEYLEKVEEGKIAPPVGTLIQISRSLSVDSSALLAEGKMEERRRSYRKRTKAYSYKNLTPDAEDKHLWAYLVTLDPKKEHEMVVYRHEGEEFVYVLEGRVEITVGEEATVVKKGGSIHFNSAMAHNLKNLSTKRTKLLVVVFTP
ncbi:MAG: cupin domain-containing protein [Desulfomonilaceae bacterium]|nr:cupin domain-containing protein [Desulfomonilaceae bacterium]